MTDPTPPPALEGLAAQPDQGQGQEPAPAGRERYAGPFARLRADVNAALAGQRRAEVGVEVGRFILQAMRATGTGPTRSELAAHLGIAGRFPPPDDLPATRHRRWEMAAVSVTVGVLRRHGYVTYTPAPRSLRTGPAFYPAVKARRRPAAKRSR